MQSDIHKQIQTQAGSHTDRKTCIHTRTEIHTERHNIHTGGDRCRHMHAAIQRHTYIQAYIHTCMHTYRETYIQKTCMYTYRYINADIRIYPNTDI